MEFPKTSTMLAATAITLGLAAGASGIAYAASDSQSTNPMDSLVNAIATKFNLNAADVAQVFDDQHAQIQAEHQQEYKDRLSQAVTDGELTQEQADKILAKHQELQAEREVNRDTFANMTAEQRRTAMQEKMEALKQWASENDIPEQYMRLGIGKGHGGLGGHGFDRLDQSTSEQSNN